MNTQYKNMRNTSNIGNIGQAAVINKFVELGINIYLPFGDGYVVDLIAEWNNKLHKIQVKTTECSKDGNMTWRLGKQEGFHGTKVKYTSEEVDYFALYCIETKTLCLVPFKDCEDQLTICIKSDNFNGIKYKTMHFESDFSFEKIINK